MPSDFGIRNRTRCRDGSDVADRPISDASRALTAFGVALSYPSRSNGHRLDYYSVLGVERGACDAEIKRAFRRLAQQWHPDVNEEPGAPERFKEINEAYQVLSDPQRRQPYDLFGRAGVGGGGEGDSGSAPPGSVASAASSTRSSAVRRPPRHGAGGRRRDRTCATTCGSRSRRRSPGPRRRSTSGCSTRARPAAAAGPKPGHPPRRARIATDAARFERCARRCSGRWSTCRRARAAGARVASSRPDASRARARAASSASATFASRSRPASTRATRSGCPAKARSGRAAAPRGAFTWRSTLARTQP